MHHLEFDKPKVLRHAPQSTSTKLACCTLHSSGMDTRAHGCTTRYRFPDWCLHKQLRTWGGWKSAITSLVDTPRQNIWLSWAFIRPDIRPGCWLLVSGCWLLLIVAGCSCCCCWSFLSFLSFLSSVSLVLTVSITCHYWCSWHRCCCCCCFVGRTATALTVTGQLDLDLHFLDNPKHPNKL